MLCREHAAQLRRDYDEITGKGGDVVGIGTGDRRYAAAFVREEHIPFTVLLDDDGAAAEAAAVRHGRVMDVLGPSAVLGGIRALRHGKRQHRTGIRPFQLGATFVVGPGDAVRYEHLDDDVADHAPMVDVLAAVSDA